jgi:hypothetical protein
VNTPEDLRDRIALLGEFTINRRVTALDSTVTMAHAQKLMVIAYSSDLQVSLPSTCIDDFFQLVIQHTRVLYITERLEPGGGRVWTYVKE